MDDQDVKYIEPSYIQAPFVVVDANLHRSLRYERSFEEGDQFARTPITAGSAEYTLHEEGFTLLICALDAQRTLYQSFVTAETLTDMGPGSLEYPQAESLWVGFTHWMRGEMRKARDTEVRFAPSAPSKPKGKRGGKTETAPEDSMAIAKLRANPENRAAIQAEWLQNVQRNKRRNLRNPDVRFRQLAGKAKEDP